MTDKTGIAYFEICNMLFERYSLSVCNVGHVRSGGSCVLCPGNTIKKTVGDAENCDADASCDGVTEWPNPDHTACGKFVICDN